MEVIPYVKDKTTLCIVCNQRIEIENTENEIVFKEAKNVTVDDSVQIIHATCF